MRRILVSFFALTLLTLPAAVSSAKDCTLATKGDSPIVKACKEGGIKAAKKAMKKMVKAAKKKDMKTDCDTCHPDDDYGKLTDDGKEKFEKMLKLVGDGSK